MDLLGIIYTGKIERPKFGYELLACNTARRGEWRYPSKMYVGDRWAWTWVASTHVNIEVWVGAIKYAKVGRWSQKQ